MAPTVFDNGRKPCKTGLIGEMCLHVAPDSSGPAVPLFDAGMGCVEHGLMKTILVTRRD
jgi:hypothetical protein